VISFDLSCTFACAKTSRCSLAHALTKCRLWCLIRGHRSHWHFAIHCNHLNPHSFTSCFTHPSKQSSNCFGSIRSNTRRNVSSLGIPLARTRNVDNQACLLTPYNSMSSQPSPPAITDRIAIVKISDNRCKRVRSTRGSSIVAKHVCRRWQSSRFAAATDESVAEQNQQILGHESSQGAEGSV